MLIPTYSLSAPSSWGHELFGHWMVPLAVIIGAALATIVMWRPTYLRPLAARRGEPVGFGRMVVILGLVAVIAIAATALVTWSGSGDRRCPGLFTGFPAHCFQGRFDRTWPPEWFSSPSPSP